MKTWIGLAVVTAVAVATLAGASRADAYNEPTHETINRLAGAHATVDGALRETLGFLFGVETPIRDRRGTTRSVLEWLAFGGYQEDQPACRRTRHFHDPTQPWHTAGLRTLNLIVSGRCAGIQFESSVRWGQNPLQSPGDQMSWLNAREFMFTALTSRDAGVGRRRDKGVG